MTSIKAESFCVHVRLQMLDLPVLVMCSRSLFRLNGCERRLETACSRYRLLDSCCDISWRASDVSQSQPRESDRVSSTTVRIFILLSSVLKSLSSYQGEIDYVSPPASALSTQQYFSQLGSTQVELVVVPNASHGDMGHAGRSATLTPWS